MAHGRIVGTRRRSSVALLAGGALVGLALLAPVDLLALVRGPGPTPGPTRTVPAATDVDSVRGPQAATRAQDVPTDAGRWGQPADRPTSGPRVEELRGGWRVEAGAEEAAALGVLVAREWVRTRTAGVLGAGMLGADVAVTLEAVERPGASHAVVTVVAVHGDVVERLAVPILFRDGGPVAAGAPWTLPSPSLTTEPLVGTVVGDEALVEAARTALERVGIPGSRLVRLEVTDGWPFIARLEEPTDGHPWLRWHLDRFVVTGLPLDRAEERS